MPRYRPVHPKLIDPAGVQASAYPRPMGITTDESRAQTVQATGGQPMVDYQGKSNPYNDYQSIDLLLSLQNPRSEGYDEMGFFVMGQVKELLFRGLHFELYNAQQQIKADNVVNALEIFPRARAFAEFITRSWDVLSTISPEGFNQFRNSLGAAPGQLSFMYRHVEFILGNKDARRGYVIDAAALERDWSQPYSINASVEQAWLQVYKTSGPENDLYRLAEALVGIADQLSQYRWRHFVSVQRLLGLKPGTGGSDGVGWLRHVTEHRFFPELWSIRTQF